MIETDLLELIKRVQTIKAESQVLELKAAHQGCPKKLYDTISAFSNQDSGGIILFGIDERQNFAIVGVYDVQDLQKKVNEQCKQMMPVVRPVFTAVSFPQGNVVAAEIPGIDLTERPCYYGGVGRTKGSYIRAGDSDEPMSDYEIYSYEAFRRKYQDDIRINERADMSVIDLKNMKQYLDRIKESNPRMASLPQEDIERFLNMVVNEKPTLVCTLLFSVYPQMFYPQYTINAMVVPGYAKGAVTADGSRFIDNKRIEGNLLDMLEDTMRFLKKNMRVSTVIEKESGRRADRTEYPLMALREAVLNSLVHRDYSIHTEAMPIEVIMYKNRLEIRNPGGLYGRLTLDKLGKVQPDTRNPVLARAMETLGVTENRYSGIPTIQRELRLAGMKEAVFADSRDEFVVTFYNNEPVLYNELALHDGMMLQESFIEEKVTPFGEKKEILLFCKKPRTRKEIADYLGIKTIHYVMEHYINPLVETGKLQMTIPEKPKSRNQRYYSVR